MRAEVGGSVPIRRNRLRGALPKECAMPRSRGRRVSEWIDCEVMVSVHGSTIRVPGIPGHEPPRSHRGSDRYNEPTLLCRDAGGKLWTQAISRELYELASDESRFSHSP